MTKVISLSDAAYEEMKLFKEEDESFSDVVLKLSEHARQKPLLDFFGKWPGKPEEAERIKKTLEKERKLFATREVKL